MQKVLSPSLEDDSVENYHLDERPLLSSACQNDTSDSAAIFAAAFFSINHHFLLFLKNMHHALLMRIKLWCRKLFVNLCMRNWFVSPSKACARRCRQNCGDYLLLIAELVRNSSLARAKKNEKYWANFGAGAQLIPLSVMMNVENTRTKRNTSTNSWPGVGLEYWKCAMICKLSLVICWINGQIIRNCPCFFSFTRTLLEALRWISNDQKNLWMAESITHFVSGSAWNQNIVPTGFVGRPWFTRSTSFNTAYRLLELSEIQPRNLLHLCGKCTHLISPFILFFQGWSWSRKLNMQSLSFFARSRFFKLFPGISRVLLPLTNDCWIILLQRWYRSSGYTETGLVKRSVRSSRWQSCCLSDACPAGSVERKNCLQSKNLVRELHTQYFDLLDIGNTQMLHRNFDSSWKQKKWSLT